MSAGADGQVDTQATIGANSGPPDEGRRAMLVLGGVVALVLVVLMGRLAMVQVLTSAGYREIATGNRVRVVQTPAPRGRILDVNGRVLAGSRPAYRVTLHWEPLSQIDGRDRSEVFAEVVEELVAAGHDDMDVAHLEERYRWARQRTLEPLPLAEDVEAGLWIRLSEIDLPGIEATEIPARTYPFGRSAAHLLGYVGSVGDREEAAALNRSSDTARYRAGSVIGRAGLERIFEARLRGQPEVRLVEIDSRNRVVGTVEVVQPAVPGQDVHLTVDIDLQRSAEAELSKGLDVAARSGDTPATAGSVVILDPTDGAVLALASHPTFDPGDFVFGLAPEVADELFSDPRDPLLNRAIRGQYPAGSTFKPIPAYAALTTGARSEHTIWQDRGIHRLNNCRSDAGKGCVFRNARGAVMGPLDIRDALTRSSDTYFYSLGERFWLQRDRYGEELMQQTAARFGLGRPTGIELPGESGGRLPSPSQRRTDHEQYPEAFPEPRWFTGDNVNLSIGQGDLLTTPLQLANLYATLATGGRRFEPRLIERITDPGSGEVIQVFGSRVDDDGLLDPAALAPIVDGLAAVSTEGTAANAFRGFAHDRFPLVAKTGTAEVAGQADNALFAGYGPRGRPHLAFAIVLEEAGFGGTAAAPLARAILEDMLAVGDGRTPVGPVAELGGTGADPSAVAAAGPVIGVR